MVGCVEHCRRTFRRYSNENQQRCNVYPTGVRSGSIYGLLRRIFSPYLSPLQMTNKNLLQLDTIKPVTRAVHRIDDGGVSYGRFNLFAQVFDMLIYGALKPFKRDTLRGI